MADEVLHTSSSEYQLPELRERTPAEDAIKIIRSYSNNKSKFVRNAVGAVREDVREAINAAKEAYGRSLTNSEIRRILRDIEGAARIQANKDFEDSITNEQRIAIKRARTQRGVTGYWQSTGRDEREDSLEKSVESWKSFLAKQNAVVDWFDAAVPTEETFGDINGVIESTQDGVKYTVKRKHVFYSIRNTFNLLSKGYRHRLDRWESELDLYEVDEYEDIINACEALGLIHVYKEKDDGYLWFVNPDDDQLYSYCLAPFNRNFDVCTSYEPVNVEDFKNNADPSVDLSYRFIRGGHPNRQSFEGYTRDRFGMFNTCRKWLKMHVSKGNSIPEGISAGWVNGS